MFSWGLCPEAQFLSPPHWGEVWMGLVAIVTVEAGMGVAAVVQQQLQQGDVIHAQQHGRREAQPVCGDAGVDVGSVPDGEI